MTHQLIELLLKFLQIIADRHTLVKGIIDGKRAHEHTRRLSQIRRMPSIIDRTEKALIHAA